MMITKNPAIALALLMGACSTVQQATAEPPIPPTPPCAGTIVYATDDLPLGCDVSPPQELHLLITDLKRYQAICDDAGGYILWVDHLSAHCADIDY